MRNALLFIGLTLLSGCGMATGVRIEESQLSQFQAGKTTYPQVISALGPPTSSSVSSTGDRTISYTSFRYQTRPETFIPYVGLFVGGADTSNSTVVFVFGRDGILQRYDSSSGAVGSAMGGMSGPTSQPRTAQPR
jgi:hypothetical protein